MTIYTDTIPLLFKSLSMSTSVASLEPIKFMVIIVNFSQNLIFMKGSGDYGNIL